MASPTTPVCLWSREGCLRGYLSLDLGRVQGVATLHVDHSQNLLHREKHKVRHSFHCYCKVCCEASSLPNIMSSGSEDSIAQIKLHLQAFTYHSSVFYYLNLITMALFAFCLSSQALPIYLST